MTLGRGAEDSTGANATDRGADPVELALEIGVAAIEVLQALNGGDAVGGQASATAIDSVTALVFDWHGQKPLTLSGTRVERTGRSLVFRTTKTLKTGAC